MVIASKQREIGIVLSYGHVAINIVTNIIYVPLLLNFIGASEYGVYQLVGSFIAYISVLDFGIGTSVLKFYRESLDYNNKTKLHNVIGFGFLCSYLILIFVLILGFYAYFYIDNIFMKLSEAEINSFKEIYVLLLFNLCCSLFVNIFSSIISAHENFIYIKSIQLIGSIFRPVMISLCLLSWPTAYTVALNQTIFNFLVLSAYAYKCLYKYSIKISPKLVAKDLMKSFCRLSTSCFLVTIVDQIFWRSNQIILGIYRGSHDVAVYSISTVIYMAFMPFSTIISNIYTPKIISLNNAPHGDKKISLLFINIGRYQFIILYLFLLLFISCGKNFISLWAGPDFARAYSIVLLVIIPFIIDLIQNTGLQILKARNHYMIRAKVYIIMGILCLFLSVYCVDKWGVLGCAFSIGLSMLLGNGLIMNFIYAYIEGLPIRSFWREIARIILIQSPTLLLSIYLSINITDPTIWSILVACSIIVILYTFIMYFLVLRDQEKKILLDRFHKINLFIG